MGRVGLLEGMGCLVPCRLSQKHESQTGLDTQDQDTRRWIEAEGGHVVAMPKDRITGTKAPWDRKELGPWLTDPLKRAQYQAIIPRSQDRLSRADWRDEAAIRIWVEDNQKLIIIWDKQLFWPPRPDQALADKLRWEIGAADAREEWEKVKRRTDRMRRELWDNNYLVGVAGYGWQIAQSGEHKTLIHWPEQADTCRRMAKMWLDDGMSGHAIAQALNADGVDTYTIARLKRKIEIRQALGKSTDEAEAELKAAIESGKGKWSPASIYQILTNPMITGRRKAGGQRSPGRTILRVEPIIDIPTYNKIMATIRERGNRNGISPSDTALLTGHLFCGQCRGPMYRHNIRNVTGQKKLYTYYRCHGNERSPSRCKLMAPLEETEQVFADLLWEIWGKKPYKETTVIPGTNWDEEIKAIKQDFNESHDPEDEDYLERYQAMMGQIAELRSRPVKADKTVDKIVPGLTQLDVWLMGPDVAAQRRLLRRWGLKVYLYKDDAGGIALRTS